MGIRQFLLGQLDAIGRGEGLVGSSRVGRIARTCAAVISQGERWQQVSPSLRAAELDTLVHQVAGSRTVLHGPLQGLKFPASESFGSRLLPKILGSYEFELHGIIEEVAGGDYPLIVDVGCAEGYYAVGLALRCQNATVVACDIEPRAQTLCAAMAAHNGVAERVKTRGAVDPARLTEIVAGSARGFLLSDCEGYEGELFSAEVGQALRGWDVLIELHDALQPGLSAQLVELFCATHDVEIVHGVSSSQRVAAWHQDELERYSYADREFLLHEGRQSPQDWLWGRARS